MILRDGFGKRHRSAVAVAQVECAHTICTRGLQFSVQVDHADHFIVNEYLAQNSQSAASVAMTLSLLLG